MSPHYVGRQRNSTYNYRVQIEYRGVVARKDYGGKGSRMEFIVDDLDI